MKAGAGKTRFPPLSRLKRIRNSSRSRKRIRGYRPARGAGGNRNIQTVLQKQSPASFAGDNHDEIATASAMKKYKEEAGRFAEQVMPGHGLLQYPSVLRTQD